METECNAKVVTPVWGAEFVQFLAALAVFVSVDFKETVELNCLFQIDRLNSTVSS